LLSRLPGKYQKIIINELYYTIRVKLQVS